MASDQVIEEIKQRLDLVDYIGRHVELKRAGRTYKARCPFHTENTPSFVLFPHTNTWHCFGACGEGGDIFSYVQKREGLGFAEALTQLAREAGIPLEEENEALRQSRERREQLLATCEAAMQQYQQWLRELPEAALCRAYLQRRGLDQETIHRFGLGYAPNRWEALLQALTARGYAPGELAEVGLVHERDQGGYYDSLRHRLVFPIHDERGRVVGFGGRALDDEQQPKYLNSPQGPLFDKGRLLYGLALAKEGIRRAGRAVVVEGYMDVIAAQQMGYTNVVAALGTALTQEQLQLLQRYSPHLTLALDADEAGQRAVERGLETLLSLQQQLRRERWERARQGKGRAQEIEGDLRVLLLPPGYDPDELIREEPAQWERRVAEAQPVLDYLIGRRVAGLSLDDPHQKAEAAAALMPLLATLDSTLVRNHYLQRLARLLQSDERLLGQELAHYLEGTRRPTRSALAASPPPEPPPEAWLLDEPPPEEMARYADEGTSHRGPDPRSSDGYLLYLLLEQPDLLEMAQEEGVRATMWAHPLHRQLFSALCDAPLPSATHLEEWLAELEPLLAAQARRIVALYAALPPLPAESWAQEAQARLNDFLIRHDEQQARQLQYLIDDLQRTLEAGDEIVPLLQQLNEIGARRLARQRRQQAARLAQRGQGSRGP